MRLCTIVTVDKASELAPCMLTGHHCAVEWLGTDTQNPTYSCLHASSIYL